MLARTPSCLHCASPCSEHAFNHQSNITDSALILDDIERLDKAIHRLGELRLQRCRQLNAIRSSTRILPNEILISIFKYFCSLFDSYKFPQFILGGVCSHWRNLLNTEPLFWRTFRLLGVAGKNILSCALLLDVFKERNGACFEYMEIDFGCVDEETSEYQRLLSSLNGLSTLSEVTLNDPPVDVIRIVTNELNTPDLCLNGPSNLAHQLGSISRLSLPWSTLTILTLYFIPVNVCFELLLGCPNLIEFWSYFPRDPTDSAIQPNTRYARETHFPHLQHLTWEHDVKYSNWDNNLLSFYRFPALRHFGWLGLEHGYSLQRFSDFTSFLPPSCTFQLSGAQHEAVDLRMDILQQIAYPVEELICTTHNMNTLNVALILLQGPSFIPSLTLFRWEHPAKEYTITRDIFLEIARLFKNAIRGRKNTGVGRFRMEIEGMELPEGFSKQSGYELMGGGFDFEIVEGDYDCWKISF